MSRILCHCMRLNLNLCWMKYVVSTTNRLLLWGLCVLGVATGMAQETEGGGGGAASDPAGEKLRRTVLGEVVVRAESYSDETVQGSYLPAVLDQRIFAGKKSTVVDFDAMPQIQSDNYRQAFAKTPGLLVSELPNPSLLSIGSRGIGDPHESQNILVLKDGIPFVLDLLTYPTVYYQPPFEAIDRLEYTRGGSALLYGPQPGGALNYVTHMPHQDRPISAATQHVFGSDGLYNTFTRVDGTSGRVGYLAYYDHRQGDSFREANSDFQFDAASVKIVLDAERDTRWIFNFDASEAESGEPGFLNFGNGANDLNYNANREATQTQFDRLELSRYVGSLRLEHDFSEGTQLAATAWAGYVDRTSYRQRGTGFGTVPTGAAANTNNIHEHIYYTGGLDTRLRHDWEGLGAINTLTAGFTFYYSDAPITQKRGLTPDATDGIYFQDIDRSTAYGAYFAENRFTWGDFSLIPALRVEHFNQSFRDRGRLNDATLTPLPLRDVSETAHVPLLGLGAEYAWQATATTVYGNISQGYKAKTFGDFLPSQNNVNVTDADPSNIWNYEIGWRGQPARWLEFDTSLFLIDYDNRFGSTTAGGVTTVGNVGRSVNMGWDLAAEANLIGLAELVAGHAPGEWTDTYGSLALYTATELLSAEFVSGPLDGRTPQYAPDYVVRVGTIYRWRDRIKLGLLGTFVGDHFANDNNTANFHIPAYMVWDLTMEWKVWKNHLAVLAGINNLLDEDYYSRIRPTGIDPAYGRNFYAGIRLEY